MADDISVAIVVNAKDNASSVMAGMADNLKAQARKIGLAMTAIGAAGLAVVDSAKKTNAQLAITAVGLGTTTGELRSLALATTNVTFPLEEVTASFDLLTRAGLRDTEAMARTATAFDTLGDAIGLPASQVTDILIPALKLYGEDLGDVTDITDKFTFLIRNTTVDLQDFSSALSFLAPDMKDLGITIDDTIAIMALLEARGISGSAATKELRKAVTEAVTEQISLAQVLGITQDELAVYQERLADATGLTQQYADAANTQFSIVDKLKQKFTELTLSIGSVLEPLEPLFFLMTAMGPILILVSTQVGIQTIRWIAHAASMTAATIASTSLTVALGALGVVLTVLGLSITAFIFVGSAVLGVLLAMKIAFFGVATAIWAAVAAKVAFLAAMGPLGWAILAGTAAVAAGGIFGLTKAVGAAIPSLDTPGIVPGPIGSPVMVQALGGERFGGRQSIGRGGVTTEIHLHVGMLMGTREDAESFADMMEEVTRNRQRQGLGSAAF